MEFLKRNDDMKKKIKMNLSVSDIQRTISEIKSYQNELQEKCNKFCAKLSESGIAEASYHLSESPLGKTILVKADIDKSKVGCKAMIIATGKTITNDYGTVNSLLLVEFGSGIYYNHEQNPKADEYGMGIGTFPDQTHAFEDGWWFLNDNGDWIYSHGVKATMPMYNAGKEMRKKMVSVAKEVFR